jgi:integrase
LAKTKFREADQRWVATVEVQSFDGRRKRRWFYGATKREAETKRDDAIAREGGRLGAAQVGTVGAFVDRWLSEVDRSAQPTTAAVYRGVWAKHCEPRIGKKRLSSFKPCDVSVFYDQLLAANVGRAAISKAKVVMHRAFQVARRRRDFVGDNPFALVAAPRYQAKERKSLTLEQARRFIAVALQSSDRYAGAIVLAISCGLRWGEVFGLVWGDVDWVNGVLSVRRSLQQVGRAFSFSEGKTETARRKITLPSMAIEALRRRQAIAEQDGPEGLVFTSIAGTPVDRHDFRERHFKRLLKAAEVPVVSFHELRHSFATLQFQLGQPTKVVSEILGHSGPGITARLYQHVIGDMHGAAMRAIDEALSTS